MKETAAYKNYETNTLYKLSTQGNELAFKTLYNRYYGKALAYALGLTKNRQDSEDLVQEIFTKLYTIISSGTTSIEDFEKYLFTGLKNNFLSKVRKENSRREKKESLNIKKYTCKDQSKFEVQNLENHYKKQLTVEQAKVFGLHMDGYPNREIAKKLKSSSNNVGSILNRAKNKLKKFINEK